MKEIYKAKGYSDDWIEKRVRGIAIRDELTDEWKKRGVLEEIDYDLLSVSPLGRHETHYYHPSHDRLPPKYTFGCMVPLCFLAVALYVLYRLFCAEPYNPAERYQKKASDSLVYYLKTVEDYLTGGRGVYARDIMFCVTKDDDWWFNHNYESIAAAQEGRVYATSERVSRLGPAELALHVLLNRGPTSSKAQYKIAEPGATIRTFEVTQTYLSDEPGVPPLDKTYNVELVMEGSLWKVKGFAGARNTFQ